MRAFSAHNPCKIHNADFNTDPKKRNRTVGLWLCGRMRMGSPHLPHCSLLAHTRTLTCRPIPHPDPSPHGCELRHERRPVVSCDGESSVLSWFPWVCFLPMCATDLFLRQTGVRYAHDHLFPAFGLGRPLRGRNSVSTAAAKR